MRGLAGAEDSREQGINSQAVGLLGFAGVILALTAAQARELLANPDLGNAEASMPSADGLGPVGEPVSVGLLIAAVMLIALAAVEAIRVLRGSTRGYYHVESEAVERYSSPEHLAQEATFVHGRALNTLVTQVVQSQRANVGKARRLRLGLALMVSGLAALGAQVLVFLARTVGV